MTSKCCVCNAVTRFCQIWVHARSWEPWTSCLDLEQFLEDGWLVLALPVHLELSGGSAKTLSSAISADSAERLFQVGSKLRTTQHHYSPRIYASRVKKKICVTVNCWDVWECGCGWHRCKMLVLADRATDSIKNTNAILCVLTQSHILTQIWN